MKKSQIIALMLLQMLTIPILAFSWGQFDVHTARCFFVANMVWQVYVLSTLFEYVPEEKK